MNALTSVLGPWLPGLMVAGGLIGTASFCLVYKSLEYWDDQQPSVEQRRLRQLQGIDGHRAQVVETVPLAERLKRKLKPYAHKIYTLSEEQKASLEKQLMHAGRPHHTEALLEVLAERLFLGCLCGLVGFLLMIPLPVPIFFHLGMLMLGLYGGGLLPMVAVKQQATVRKQQIQRTLPELLDLMVVCVQAGLALDSTMRRVAGECEKIAPELSHEFQVLGRDLNAGLPRAEAFTSLSERNGVDELKSLCALIVQSDRMGVSVSQALKVFSEELRTRRRQRAEEMAAKASVKMTFPLVFFVFPPMMIILLGPMVMQMIKVFGGQG